MYQAVGHALQINGIAFSSEDSTPLSGELRMDLKTKPTSKTNDENDEKHSLLEVTIVNPNSNKYLTIPDYRSSHPLAKAEQYKQTTYRESYDHAIYALKSLASSTCGEVGEDTVSF